jgi:predicted  nucleic acid-binding Zn-ribbon protein
MNAVIENLFALQQLELANAAAPNHAEQIATVRAKIPEPILTHFDRLWTRGKNGVAVVRHGVCTECHLAVAVGVISALALGDDLQLCGNCGRYLYLPPDEPVLGAASAASDPQRKPRRKRTVAHGH